MWHFCFIYWKKLAFFYQKSIILKIYSPKSLKFSWKLPRRTKRWDLSGTVIEQRNRRSYLVEAENGKRYLRNRIFLRPDNLSDKSETSMAEPEVESSTEPEIKSALRRSERTCAKKKTVYFKKWWTFLFFIYSF